MKKNRIHYGWFIVAAGMMIIAAAIGLVGNSFSIFIVPVGEELGFTRSQMSLNQTILAMGGIVVSFLWGTFLKHFRLKRLMALAAVMTCGCYFLYSVATKLWMFYIISGFISIGTALLSWMPFTTIINNWFNKKRGFALGLTFMGSGIGGMIFNALGGVLINSAGWRSTFMIFSIVLVALIVPATLFVVKIKPADVGLAPYGGELETVEKGGEMPGYTLAQARKMRSFYVILACALFIGICLNAVNSIMAPHLQSVGYSSIVAANAVSVYMAVLALGKMLFGIMVDKIGAMKTCAIAMIAEFLCNISGLLAGFPPMVAGMVLFTGLGNPFGSVAYPLVAREVYGPRECAAITGIISSMNNIGSAIGPTFCGAIFDATGSYIPAYAIMAVTVAAFGAVLIATMKISSRGKKWVDV